MKPFCDDMKGIFFGNGYYRSMKDWTINKLCDFLFIVQWQGLYSSSKLGVERFFLKSHDYPYMIKPHHSLSFYKAHS